MERLRVINLDELAIRWQIPVERIKYFITDCGMNPAQPEKWAASHWEVFMKEKQEAFESSLFPEKLRTTVTD
jgi:hypothetical protein